MLFEKLLNEADRHRVEVFEKGLLPRTKGLYGDNIIWINRFLPTIAEKACILAEELGHHHTSAGNILDQSDVRHRKQEVRARRWAYEKLVPLNSIVKAHQSDIRNRHELALFLNITEEFLQAAINFYIDKYGLSAHVGKYTVIFEPLGVLELFEF